MFYFITLYSERGVENVTKNFSSTFFLVKLWKWKERLQCSSKRDLFKEIGELLLFKISKVKRKETILRFYGNKI